MHRLRIPHLCGMIKAEIRLCSRRGAGRCPVRFRTAICLVCWLASANKMPKFKLLPLCNLQKLRQRQKILGGFLR